MKSFYKSTLLSAILFSFSTGVFAQDFHPKTAGYILCVQGYIVAGGADFFNRKGRLPHPDDLVESSMSICEEKRHSAVRDLARLEDGKDTRANRRKWERAFTEKVDPQFRELAHTVVPELK